VLAAALLRAVIAALLGPGIGFSCAPSASITAFDSDFPFGNASADGAWVSKVAFLHGNETPSERGPHGADAVDRSAVRRRTMNKRAFRISSGERAGPMEPGEVTGSDATSS
jgi:hypothetical protein